MKNTLMNFCLSIMSIVVQTRKDEIALLGNWELQHGSRGVKVRVKVSGSGSGSVSGSGSRVSQDQGQCQGQWVSVTFTRVNRYG